MAVFARDHGQQQCDILNRACHRATVVQRQFNRECAGVGHQTMGRFETVDTGPGCRHAYGTPLVAAKRHVHRTYGYQDRAAAGRAAGCTCRIMGIGDGMGHGSKTGTGQAKILTGRFAQDGSACIEDARDDGGVIIGDIPLHGAGPVHHRHTGNTDVVLDCN